MTGKRKLVSALVLAALVGGSAFVYSGLTPRLEPGRAIVEETPPAWRELAPYGTYPWVGAADGSAYRLRFFSSGAAVICVEVDRKRRLSSSTALSFCLPGWCE